MLAAEKQVADNSSAEKSENYRWTEDNGRLLVWNNKYSQSKVWGHPIIVTAGKGKRPFVSDYKTLQLQGYGKDFFITTFTELGQIKGKDKDSLCFSVRSGSGYIVMETCSIFEENQKFRYLTDEKKIESVAFPGKCLTFSRSGSYHGAAFGYLYLISCKKDSIFLNWGYNFGSEAGTGAGNKNGLHISRIDTIKVVPKQGPSKGVLQRYLVNSSMLLKIEDWRHIHVTVPNPLKEPFDCNKINCINNAFSKKECIAKHFKATCQDYNKAFQSLTGNDLHFNNPFYNIKEWWNRKQNYMDHVDLVINGGYFDVQETLRYRENPVPYSTPCTSVYGLTISNGVCLSWTNSIIFKEGTYMGQLDALYFEETESVDNLPSYVKRVKILSSKEVSKMILNNTAVSQYVNAVSGVQIAKNNKVIRNITLGAKPTNKIARTLIGVAKNYQLFILIVQNGQPGKRQSHIPNVHNGGIDLYGAATWMLETYPEIVDIISLDNSGSVEAAMEPRHEDQLKLFNSFKDKDGRKILVTNEGDIHNHQRTHRPIPSVIYMSVGRPSRRKQNNK